MEKQIVEILRKHYHFKLGVRIEESTELINSGLAESFDITGLRKELEQAFGIQFSPEDLEMDDFGSIERIEHLVARYQRKAQNLAQPEMQEQAS
ncbi:phosphopantetheine-binding protein [Eubacterium sp. F2]|uniref:phosphopantetheine-binding protein n=1 Tax=Eubacterium sp. F2 TaxID=3381348 RepID=UPI0039084300